VRILFWIVRILAILVLLRIVLRMIFGPRAVRTRPGGPQARPKSPERLGGELVRCVKCGTYTPKTRALVKGSGDTAIYFCSETCRDAYSS
jgi:hypothetical protein